MCRDYPFVTTGGGGVAQPAIVARVSTAMIAKASFFIDILPGAMNGCTIVGRPPMPSAQKTQSTRNHHLTATFANLSQIIRRMISRSAWNSPEGLTVQRNRPHTLGAKAASRRGSCTSQPA